METKVMTSFLNPAEKGTGLAVSAGCSGIRCLFWIARRVGVKSLSL